MKHRVRFLDNSEVKQQKDYPKIQEALDAIQLWNRFSDVRLGTSPNKMHIVCKDGYDADIEFIPEHVGPG